MPKKSFLEKENPIISIKIGSAAKSPFLIAGIKF